MPRAMPARRKASDAAPPAKRQRGGDVDGDENGEDGVDAGLTPRRSRRDAAGRAAAATAAAAAVEAAEEAAAALVPTDEDILARLFVPVTAAERAAWQGWTDIESEPAFFNFILGELGICDAKIHEVFTVDMASPAYLPNPAGFIFLYKFVEDDEPAADGDGGPPVDLWFANQTTSNACATIAMLNIAMNCPGLRLGAALDDFKERTRRLSPALRGHLLSADAFIRARHNAFARRLDMLASDMALRVEWEEAHTTKGKAAKARAKSRAKKAKKLDDDSAFHFIAYVPLGQDVWELNGMQDQGRRIGTFSDDWTAMVRERVAERMLAYQAYDDSGMFSLLALCRTADGGHTEDVAEDVARAAARRRDYTPAVHCWVQKLAEKGVLRHLATGEDE